MDWRQKGNTMLLCFLVVGLICITSAQLTVKEMTADDPHAVYRFDSSLTSEECLKQMQGILSPQQLQTLGTMVNLSGKGLNQLGLYESCNGDDLEYTLLYVELIDFKFALASVGICAPKQCSSQENYQTITDMLEKAIKSDPKSKDLNLAGRVYFPHQDYSNGPNTGFWVVFALICVILLFWIIGILVQFTKLGDIRRDQENEESNKIEDRKSKLALLFYSFNPIVNIQKLFTVRPGGDQRLNVLNGVRVLSICWVIAGHSFGFTAMAPVANSMNLERVYTDVLFSIVPAGMYAVDSFFYLSGFLSCYLLTSKMYPKKGKISLPLLYFHRYYRLIFPIVFCTLLMMYFMKYLGDGPIYRKGWDSPMINCNTYWWPNLIMINNFYPWDMTKECIGWVWYLANDFQFYLITPFIIMAYCKNRRLGYAIALSLIIISMLVNGIFTLIYDISIFLNAADGINAMNVLYSKPWGRMGPYFVGAIFGFGFFELSFHEKYPELKETLSNRLYNILKNSRLISILCLIIGIGLTALYTFPMQKYFIDCGQKPSNCWNVFPSFLYNLTSRPFFVFGFAIVLAPTYVGRLRFIKNLLGSNIFAVLGRLNYSAYLIHILVLLWFLNDTRQAIYYNSLNLWFMTIGVTIATFFFSIPFTLMCEAPFMNIEKYILFPPKKREEEDHMHKKQSKEYENLIPVNERLLKIQEASETVDTK